MNLGLKNKNVIVTGASRGIGFAIADSFLKEGAKVMLISRGSKLLDDAVFNLRDKYGAENVEKGLCDCSNKDALDSLSKRINEKWSKIDVVISNVGDGQSTNLPIPPDEEWKKSWSQNFESALLTSRVFLPFLIKSKGCLLFISSIAGLEAFGAPVNYSTAKASMIAFSKNLARKVADDVRVNVIAPGNVIFPGSSWDVKMQENQLETLKLIDDSVPMKRFGKPDEIADAAVFMCSSRAKFITGSVLVVDGGQTVGV